MSTALTQTQGRDTPTNATPDNPAPKATTQQAQQGQGTHHRPQAPPPPQQTQPQQPQPSRPDRAQGPLQPAAAVGPQQGGGVPPATAQPLHTTSKTKPTTKAPPAQPPQDITAARLRPTMKAPPADTQQRTPAGQQPQQSPPNTGNPKAGRTATTEPAPPQLPGHPQEQQRPNRWARTPHSDSGAAGATTTAPRRPPPPTPIPTRRPCSNTTRRCREPAATRRPQPPPSASPPQPRPADHHPELAGAQTRTRTTRS